MQEGHLSDWEIVFFVILSQSKRKIAATSKASATDLSTQQNQVDKAVEEYLDIFSSPTRVPLHCQVKHPIDLTPGTPLPIGSVYRHSLLENEEIKRQIQELIHKGHISSHLIALWEPNRTGAEEIWNMVTLH
jgi:hypothetical protein